MILEDLGSGKGLEFTLEVILRALVSASLNEAAATHSFP